MIFFILEKHYHCSLSPKSNIAFYTSYIIHQWIFFGLVPFLIRFLKIYIYIYWLVLVFFLNHCYVYNVFAFPVFGHRCIM